MDYTIEYCQMTPYAITIEADSAEEAVRKVMEEEMEFDELDSFFSDFVISNEDGDDWSISNRGENLNELLELLLKESKK